MKYCRKGDDVFYHTVMTITKTKTNTKTKTDKVPGRMQSLSPPISTHTQAFTVLTTAQQICPMLLKHQIEVTVCMYWTNWKFILPPIYFLSNFNVQPILQLSKMMDRIGWRLQLYSLCGLPSPAGSVWGPDLWHRWELSFEIIIGNH